MARARDAGDGARSVDETGITRRRLIQYGMGASAGLLAWRFVDGVAVAQAPGTGVLDPLSIPKYATPLVIPPAMPRSGKPPGRKARGVDYYEIAVREFDQHLLPASM